MLLLQLFFPFFSILFYISTQILYNYQAEFIVDGSRCKFLSSHRLMRFHQLQRAALCHSLLLVVSYLLLFIVCCCCCCCCSQPVASWFINQVCVTLLGSCPQFAVRFSFITLKYKLFTFFLTLTQIYILCKLLKHLERVSLHFTFDFLFSFYFLVVSLSCSSSWLNHLIDGLFECY